MNEYNRQVAIIEKLARFCPICGAELVTQKITQKSSPRGLMAVSYDMKLCPNGDGRMDVGPAEGWAGPHAIFELNEKLFEEETVE